MSDTPSLRGSSERDRNDDPSRSRQALANPMMFRRIMRGKVKLRIRRKQLSMTVAIIVPLIIAFVCYLIIWLIGLSYGSNLAISGSIFAVLSFVAAQLQARAPMHGNMVTVILASQGPYSRARGQGIYDTIAPSRGWSCTILAPPADVDNVALWQENQLRHAASSWSDAIVLENRSTFVLLQDTIKQLRDLGVYIVVMGDSPGDPQSLPAGAALTFIASDPALGGWIAGGLVTSFLSSHDNSSALVAVVDEPIAARPRGAYCALAIALSIVRRDTDFVSVQNSDDIEPVVERALAMLKSFDGLLVIACITDRQLMKIAREFRERVSLSLCDRIYLIGYDAATDSSGDLLIANSPIHVFGTVDTQAGEQGRKIADEILSVAAGLEPRQLLMSEPKAVQF